jgi:catecholate siderophore receptor
VTFSRQATIRLLSGIAAFSVAMPAMAEEAAGEAEGPEITVYGRQASYSTESSSSSTKTDTKLIDTPQSVSVINRMQLDDQGVESLNDALRYVPGVTLGLGEGHRDQITLRGQSSTADFFLDGLRDDAQYYRPLYNIERVEVLKGANAMIFGRGGGGGVINRVSKTPDHVELFGSASGSADSFGAWTLAADANLPVSDAVALRINATREDFDNHRDYYGGHFTGVAPTLGLTLGTATDLVLAYEYAEDRRLTDRGVPSVNGSPIRGQDDTLFGDPAANRSEVTAHIARARLDHRFSDSLSFNLTGQYGHYDKFYANVYPRGATATTVELEGYNNGTVRENAIVQGNLIWKGDTGALKHTLLLGFEAGWQSTDNVRAEAQFGSTLAARTTVAITRPLVLPTIRFSAPSRSSTSDARTLSAYIQDQLEIGEHVQVIGGLRYDDFRISSLNRINNFAASRSDGKWSPRLGLVFKPQPNLSLYASYARSFLPQSGDQFTVLDATTATLAPEEFRNLEAGIKWDFTPDLGLTAAVFKLDRYNTRATDPLTGNPVQTGRSRAEGFELALNGRITPQWQASLGYAYQDGEILSATTAAPAGRRLAQLPKHQITAWTRYDLKHGFGLGLGLVHQSSQFSTISNAVTLPGFTRIDAAAYYDVSDKLSLQLNVENLTDADYFPSAHTDYNIATGKPINAKLTARIKF